jgi:hypothetical protein
MARAIPTYQRQNLAGGIQSAPNASSSVSANDPVAQALGNLGQALGNTGNALGDEAIRNATADRQVAEKAIAEAKRAAENAAAVDVSNVLSTGDVYWQEDSARRMQAWKVGDPDLRDGIGKDFDKWTSESAAKLPTDASRKYFQQHAATMKARLQTNAFSFQEKSTTAKLNAESDVARQADEDTVYNEPGRLDEVFQRWTETLLVRTDIVQADKIKMADAYRRKLSLAVERGEMERDPAGWYRKRFGEYNPKAVSPSASQPSAAVTRNADGTVTLDIDKSLPAGMRNNNPGNIIWANQKNALGPSVNRDNNGANAQAVYATPEEGMAAMYTLALKKYDGGKTTAESLIAGQGGWTPGNTAAAANIAKTMGLSATDDLKLRDPVMLQKFARALMLQEHGQASKKYSDEMVNRVAGDVLAGRAPVAAAGPTPVAATGAPAAAGAAPAARPAIEQPATFKGMDWEQQSALKAMAETKMRQDQARLQAEVDLKVRDATAMQADGKVDPFNFTQETFTQAYGADGVRRFQDYQSGRVMAADIGSYMTMAPAQIEASLQENQALVNSVASGGGSGYAAADQRQQLRIRAAQSVVKMQQDDPQAYAVKAGLSTAKPLDMGDPAKFGAELAGRAATASMLRDTYKTPYTLLMKNEAAALSMGFNKMSSDQKLAYLGAVAKSVTDPQAAQSVFQQIAPDSPVTAVAGKLMTMTGSSPIGAGMFSSGTTYNPKTVATMIIQGEELLNPNKATKKEDGKPVNLIMPKEQDLRDPFNNAVGAAFTNQPQSAEVAYQSVKAYYAAKMAQLGDYSGIVNTSAVKEAIEAVTGGASEFRNTKVIRPWGMSDDNFKDNAKKAFDAEMVRLGRKGPAANFASYGMENYGDAYRLRAGTGYVEERPGVPLTLYVTGPSFAGAGRGMINPSPAQ